jgi:hypothetical protein
VGVQVVTVPADRVEAEWTERASAIDVSGVAPVILGHCPFPGVDEVGRLIEQSRSDWVRPHPVLLSAAASLDPEMLLAARWEDTLPLGEDADDPDVMESFSEARPNTLRAIPRRLLPASGPVAVALVRPHSEEIPSVLGWGAFNACPAPEEHVAVLRYWRQRYGAQLQAMTNDILELVVASPPRTFEDALPLARQQYAYANDIVDQGEHPTVGALAAALIDSPRWHFWWD